MGEAWGIMIHARRALKKKKKKKKRSTTSPTTMATVKEGRKERWYCIICYKKVQFRRDGKGTKNQIAYSHHSMDWSKVSFMISETTNPRKVR